MDRVHVSVVRSQSQNSRLVGCPLSGRALLTDPLPNSLSFLYSSATMCSTSGMGQRQRLTWSLRSCPVQRSSAKKDTLCPCVCVGSSSRIRPLGVLLSQGLCRSTSNLYLRTSDKKLTIMPTYLHTHSNAMPYFIRHLEQHSPMCFWGNLHACISGMQNPGIIYKREALLFATLQLRYNCTPLSLTENS